MLRRSDKIDHAAIRDETIDRAIERNVPCEMQIRRSSGELFVVKSRLLGRGEHGIEIDWPTSIGQDVPIHEGLKVEVFFSIENVRWSFRSRIADLKRHIELNDEHTIIGVVLTTPPKLVNGQRRNDHRVGLGGQDVRVMVHAGDPESEYAAAPIDGPVRECRLVDLSIGGLSLLVPGEWIGITGINRPFFVTIPMGKGGSMTLLAEVRQRRRLNRSSDLRIGMKFRSWPDRREFQQLQQDIQRELVQLQRSRTKAA